MREDTHKLGCDAHERNSDCKQEETRPRVHFRVIVNLGKLGFSAHRYFGRNDFNTLTVDGLDGAAVGRRRIVQVETGTNIAAEL
jgi:hypothetical protein